MTCSVCRHPQVNAITADLAAGLTLRVIEGRYENLSRSALDRHVQHVPKAVRLMQAAVDIAGPVLAQVRELNLRTLKILQGAEADKDRGTALIAIREARRNLELVARLTGELTPQAAGETSGGPLQVTINYVDRQLNIEQKAGQAALPASAEGAEC